MSVRRARMLHGGSRAVMLACGIAASACGDRDPRWVTVVRDANYFIAIDTARIAPARIASSGRWLPVYAVWYRTDHAVPRLHREKAFDRETVQSVIQCDSLWFKVRSVDMEARDGKLVARQRTSNEELYRQRWRRVEPGTSEEVAAIAACHYARRKSPLAAAQAGTRQ